eukprot:CAMPEP_0118965540 /NCGR_PEP_ID=MMETSP1173-20130426/3087_1 /TAXON_ID=1034831 /ORGANISM="Rhizochromulina marina cf, Strain CCMP1243" /LENGTH=159 /DNA_ID=CAMNT_0006914183 /DNA_START=227 /DNA_END=706 /DNA_ORIENTATION=-
MKTAALFLAMCLAAVSGFVPAPRAMPRTRGVVSMSHFSNIKTQLKDENNLRTALTDLGHKVLETTTVRGYGGKDLEADVAIQQENGVDFGFKFNGQTYELVADLEFWDQSSPVELFLEKLNKQYAINTILETTQREGFQVETQKVLADGTVELVATRWA